MRTEVYFENILFQIVRELRQARDSIHIAVAWFTDPEICRVLEEKAQSGIEVELMMLDDELNRSIYGLDFNTLRENGGKVHFIRGNQEGGPIMHHKFCIIDGMTSISGSYNWSRRARQNNENIMIVKDDHDVYNQYFNEFSRLKVQYNVDDKTFVSESNQGLALDKILNRLHAISSLIDLRDFDQIPFQLRKIRTLVFSDQGPLASEIDQILEVLEDMDYTRGRELIIQFVAKVRTVISLEQIELPAYEFERMILKIRITSLEGELSEAQRKVRSFEVRYNKDLGFLIERILSLKRNFFKGKGRQAEEEAASQAYENFRRNRAQVGEKPWHAISEEEEAILKDLFKKSCKLCHPDMVAEPFKNQASGKFIELQEAYQSNDLEKVKKIYEEVKEGIWQTEGDSLRSRLEQIKREVAELQGYFEKLVSDLWNIRQTRVYKLVISILDWDRYFSETKEQMERELEQLEAYESANN